MTPTQALAAALASLNAGDPAEARRILAAATKPVEADDEDPDELEDCDEHEDFPPDGRFDGIPRNWMGEPC
jgi:hypothetical protein